MPRADDPGSARLSDCRPEGEIERTGEATLLRAPRDRLRLRSRGNRATEATFYGDAGTPPPDRGPPSEGSR